VKPDRYRILDATFMRSAPTLKICGEVDAPELAFIGRSNVGKSSLLGRLVSQPSLVRTSRTPGRTREVNLFSVSVRRVEGEDVRERDVVFADLPGYGYAKVNKSEKQRMGELVSDYLTRRDGLVAVCQLLDLRHNPTVEDREIFEGLSQQRFRHIIVATKADKLGLSKRKAARQGLAKKLQIDAKQIVLFSATDHFGRDEVWDKLWGALP
jgi:GTP-binding protein